MKKGRGKDHIWRFVKYKGDVAIYAKCSCGFVYGCYKPKGGGNLIMVPDPERLYPYCPICGSRKKRYIDEVVSLDKLRWE